MISYTVYKVIHYVGIFVAVTSAVAFLARAPGWTGRVGGPDPWRRRAILGHGIGLFLVLLGGFGMLARLGITEGLTLPGWIWAKLILWGALGAVWSIGKRAPERAGWGVVLVPILAAAAGTIAWLKPF